MEFSVNLFILQKAMRLMGAVAKQNDDDSDGHLLLDIRDTGELILLCSSNTLSITHVIPKCDVKVVGITAVSYGKLSSFLNAIPYLTEGVGADTVKFKGLKSELSLSIVGTNASNKKTIHKLKLRLQQAQKIAIPSPFTNCLFEINAATLRLAIPKVLYAVNPSSIRNFLQGVNINFDKDFIYFAGTDAQKLSEYKTPNTSKLAIGNYTITYAFVNALRRVVDTDSSVGFCIDTGKIKAKINNTVLHGSLLLGEEYPDYRKAFENFKHTIVVNKEELLGSLAPILPTIDKEDHNRLTLVLENNKLFLKNDYAEVEYGGEVVFDGTFIIDLNGTYLVNTLAAIMDDLITIQFSDENNAVIFDSAQFNNQKALITPVRRH